MFEFDFSRLFPRFLLNDKNGYAMAKAIEAGLNYFLEKCQDGLDCVQNVEKMPEWRLDEMAWEYNILYDYAAPVATKRIWIANAIEYYAKYGTAAAITKYLEGVFGSAFPRRRHGRMVGRSRRLGEESHSRGTERAEHP